MTHLERLLNNDIRRKQDTPILLSLAKDVGYYASILYCYLLEKQIEQYGIGDGYNLRNGRKWIPMLDEAQIWQDMPVFPDVRTINRAAEILEDAGYIVTERTGAFLDCGQTGHDGYYTGRARDRWTWWRVCRQFDDYAERIIISALEAAEYGMAGAVILGYWREVEAVLTADGSEFKKLSAAELEKVLPRDEKTIRRQIRALVEAGTLVQHPLRKKLYRMVLTPIVAVTQEIETETPVLTVVPKPATATKSAPVLLDFHSAAAVGKLAMLDFHAA
jgi:hypothetical protein